MRDLRARDLIRFSRSQPSVTDVDTSLRDVVERLIQDPATREVYVVDADGAFRGVISLRRLARSVFAHEVPDKSSATALLELLGAETAGELALEKPACVRPDDPLSKVIGVMFRYDVNEIPVVDDDRTILGSLNMLDLLAAWHAGKLDGPGGAKE